MAKWLAKEFDWDTGRYTGRYYDIAEAGIVAVFVDSFFGLDTNAGTAAAPFKTLSKAITTLNSTGANGSRIFMNGIFSENLPTQTYWYQFIGCGGGRNGRTLLVSDNIANVRVRFIKHLTKVHNISTLNYNNNYLFGNYQESTYIVNSIIKNITGNSLLVLQYQRYYYSKIINIGIGHSNSSGEPGIYINNCILINPYFFNASNFFKVVGVSSFIRHSTNLHTSLTNSLININAQFINEDNDDYNVRITSPLLGAGTVDEITGIASNVGGVEVGLPYNGITPEFTTEGGATITDLTIDSTGKFTITAPATTGTLETALMDLANIYPLENIDLFNVFDFFAGEITQGVFEDFVSPRMALTIKLKYGLTSSEVNDCPWLLIEYGKQPTFSGTGASRVGNADDTFDPNTFQTITCRYMKLFVTLQDNS